MISLYEPVRLSRSTPAHTKMLTENRESTHTPKLTHTLEQAGQNQVDEQKNQQG